jgi:hypothetical protein
VIGGAISFLFAYGWDKILFLADHARSKHFRVTCFYHLMSKYLAHNPHIRTSLINSGHLTNVNQMGLQNYISKPNEASV